MVDRNNKELVDKNGRTDYDTLAEALEAHGMFDNNNDRYGATQNFIVNYIGNFQKAVIISQNDPAKEIPMSVNEAGVVSPYYSDGQSGQVMFYNEDGAPLISDNTLLGNGTPAFKRQDYRYTVTAPDGTTYSSIDKAMGAKLKFDNTMRHSLSLSLQRLPIPRVHFLTPRYQLKFLHLIHQDRLHHQ